MYASIYLTNIEQTSFFRLPYLEYNSMMANMVKLNLAVLKISETSQEDTRGGVLGIHSPI